MTIFIVEDEDELREFLQTLLSMEHVVHAFATGRCALKAMREAAPEVLLSDLDLVDIPGEEIARQAARIERRPRIVLMSGDRPRLGRARELADRVIPKPFSIAELTEVLTESFGGMR